MALRKLWATAAPHVNPDDKVRHESKAATYRYVENEVRNWLCGALRPEAQHLNVYLDERDGRGFRLYERIDLADRPDWPAEEEGS